MKPSPNTSDSGRAFRRSTPPSIFNALDGAVQDIGGERNRVCLPRREVFHIIAAVTSDPSSLPLYREWTQQYWAALHPHSAGGAYVNFLMEEGQERIASSYMGNRERLWPSKQSTIL